MHDRGPLFDRLWNTPLGQCFIHNLIDSVDLKTVERSAASSLLDECARRLASEPGFDPYKSIGDVASRQDAYMQSPVKPASLPSFVATSFDARFAIGQLKNHPDRTIKEIGRKIEDFDREAKSTASEPVLKSKLKNIEEQIHLLVAACCRAERNGLFDIQLSTSLFSGAKKYGWWTSFSEGDEEAGCWKDKPEWCDRGEATRDILGLVHFGSQGLATPMDTPGWQPVLLATYVVPDAAVPAGTCYSRPNAVDGIGGDRFRARFGNPKAPTSDWGRTVNLKKLPGKSAFRGGREIIIEDFTPTGPIQMTICGAVWVPRGDFKGVGNYNFARVVNGRRQQATRRRRFLSI